MWSGFRLLRSIVVEARGDVNGVTVMVLLVNDIDLGLVRTPALVRPLLLLPLLVDRVDVTVDTVVASSSPLLVLSAVGSAGRAPRLGSETAVAIAVSRSGIGGGVSVLLPTSWNAEEVFVNDKWGRVMLEAIDPA